MLPMSFLSCLLTADLGDNTGLTEGTLNFILRLGICTHAMVGGVEILHEMLPMMLA